MSKSIHVLSHRHHGFAALGLSLVLSLLLFGCTTLRYAGAPPPSYNVDEDLKQLADHFNPATAVKNYYEKTTPTPKDRDAVISARLVMINLEYLKWLRTVTADKQFLDTATDILILSLNLAATATGVQTAKTVLSSISAGITGSKTSIDKYYFYEKTVPALIAAMNAQRKVVLVRILSGMKGSLEDYSFEQALADVYEYYQAGTFAGAIQAIQAEAGAKEQRQDEVIATLTPLTQEQLLSKQALTKAIGSLGEADMEKIRKAIQMLDPKVTSADNLNGAKEQLQGYVRGARTPERIGEVTRVFKNVGIPLQ